MKINAVNTLFYPDKGGATIVCDNLYQNLSKEFKVSFFNGRINSQEPCFQVKKYQYGNIEGISVNLHGLFPPDISSWIDGSMETNYHNPAMNVLFKEFLELNRPTVVHFHSLQWLGAQLIPIAKESGAITVITMHDWWWVCPRQFLVKSDGTVCSETIPTNCHSCVDNNALLKRQAFLKECLNHVNQVVVPSRTLKESLLKTGFISQSIEIIENGINYPANKPITGIKKKRPMVFSYLGTDSWLKGFEILLKAAELLETEEFLLEMHGFPVSKSDTKHSMLNLLEKAVRNPGKAIKKLLSFNLFKPPTPSKVPQVLFLPLFENKDLDNILANTDVVVIPSIQRESYSLVAREALVRKIPVITSDCGGPREVVEDGINGLVFPTGNAKSLANCMKRLIKDRDFFQQLKTNCGSDVKIPTVADQAKKTEYLYRKLVNAVKIT